MSEPQTKRRFARSVVVLAALALLAGSCSGDDDLTEDAVPEEAVPADDATPAVTDDDPEAPAEDDEPAEELDAPAEDDEAVVEPEDDTVDEEPDGGDDDPADGGSGTGGSGAEAAPDEPADEPAPTTTTEAPTTTTTTEAPTTTLPAATGLPPVEDRGENEAGVRIDLDETATLTCANAEFAREALRMAMLDDALQYAAAAADRAEPSAVVELAQLASQLRAAETAAEVESAIDTTLAICVDRGHQI